MRCATFERVWSVIELAKKTTQKTCDTNFSPDVRGVINAQDFLAKKQAVDTALSSLKENTSSCILMSRSPGGRYDPGVERFPKCSRVLTPI